MSSNFPVVLLSRPGSSMKIVPSIVQVVQVDLGDAAVIAAVLQEHKVDVVTSATPATAQKALVDGAKLAAVKLFLPSEYGFPTEGLTESALGTKSELTFSASVPEIRQYLFTRIYIGVFTEYIPRIVDYENGGKFKVIGRGHVPVSFTSLAEVTGFIAHILTTLPPTALEDRILGLTSVEHVDSITGNHGELKTFLHGISNTGRGSSGWDVVKADGQASNATGSPNALWEDHKWQSVKEVHKV
ncbi:NmrA domain-containing protein [Mycena sanguinolenta]|uniref:NmrA domain-containing protein n=1 Tax=Mycena sanguinolenta TaxID=230812 RepID=A0A8H6Y857_9AGAR|nr:NmrA domain-containing protein [Mycena sanguinolenta]